jgi:Cof subfamily protein (haloacid dehalogenase superfamily)
VRLVAVDLDGTLLNSSHKLSQATIEAVAHTRAAGVEVVLASSRGVGCMRAIVRQLQLFDPAEFISAQGALTGSLDEEGVLRVSDASRIPLATAHQVVALAECAGLSVGWYCGFDWFVPRMDELVEREAAAVGRRPVIRNPADIRREPEKLLLMSSPDRRYELEPIAETLPDGLTSQSSLPNYLEVTRSGVDKGTALARICRVRGIDADDVVAIGDGPNDLALFDFAGISIAMANAPESVRTRASMVTYSNDDDGVAAALEILIRI